MTSFWFRKSLLMNLLTCAGLLSVFGCASGGDSGEPHADGHTCIDCHTDKELLIASLEADPLPEPVGEELSEGEG